VIISRTPFRVSLFGGGTDYPAWFKEHQGSVLGGSIDKYCYISVRYLPPYFKHRSRIVYSKEEWVNDVDEIQHPSVRECLKYMDITAGVEICHQSDLLARKGLGTSSAFTVGLLNCLRTLRGKETTASTLAKNSIDIEQNWIQENVGCQDQYHCAYGGFNQFDFGNSVGRTPVDASILSPYLMMFDTGTTRIASDIAKTQIDRVAENDFILQKMYSMVYMATGYLNDIKTLGELLNETWDLKKQLSPQITSAHIDNIYLKAMKAGAYGGKLLGAGGGGYMLFLAEPSEQYKVHDVLSDLQFVPIKFENTGSRIIYNDELLPEKTGWGEEHEAVKTYY